MHNLTTDDFLDGHIKIIQERDGYRFSLDAVLLASLPRPKPEETLVDLGTGCGIIPLILAYRYPWLRITAVEMQARLGRLAQVNVNANQMQTRIAVLKRDMRSLTADHIGRPADWIVTNPPYHAPDSGRINPHTQRALARHEISLNLAQLLQTTRRLLRPGGRLAIIYPCERAIDLLSQMRAATIEPKWMQSVHPHKDEAAKMILVRGIHGGRPGMVVAPPLVLYSANGQYTPPVRRFMAP